MRIAVTGATGFVGRHAVKQLRSSGHELRAWYRGSSPPAVSGVQWVPGNLDDPDAGRRLVEGCDAVLHTALARSSQSFMAEPEDPVAYFQTNVIGTIRLIDAAEKAGAKRFVFLSSGAVHQRVADDLPLDERHPLWPESLYGASKAALETVVHAYGFSGRLEIASLRPVAIVGVDEPLENSNWFALVAAMIAGESVDVSGGGKIVLVDDLVRAIELVLQTEQPIAGQTYNCCSGFYSTHKIASLVAEITASNSQLIGSAKPAGREMLTDKIQQLGMKFGGDAEVRQILERLVAEIKQR